MHQPKILIVEDESVVALDIRCQLQELGYGVAGATRLAEEAVTLAGQLRPDLVLMDIHLAGEMDGIEAAKLIRDQWAIPVVFLTAFAGDAVVDRAKQSEPYGYVVKPFDERELRTVIEMALHKHEAELRQRAADEELAAVIRTALDGFCVLGPEGRILDLNEAGCRIHGHTREEMLGRSITDFVLEDAPGDTAARLERVRREGSLRSEHRIRTPAGTTRDLEISSSYRATFGGRIIAFFRDVTERKRAEAVLRVRLRLSEFAATASLEELLQKTLDECEGLTGSRIGFFHFVDPDQNTLRLQAWSTNTLAHMCNAQGKGQHYPISEAGVWVDCLRERRPVIHNDYASLPHRKGMPEGHAPVIRELVIPVIREGAVVAVLGVGNKPTDYLDPDVEMMSNLAHLCWDIIARKRADLAQRQSETQIEALLNAATESILLLDRSGRVLSANDVAATRLRLLREDLIGTNAFDSLPPEVSVSRRARLEEVFTTGRPVRFTDQRAGRWLDQNLVPVWDAHGHITSVAVFASDITESREATEALQAERNRITRIFQAAPVGLASARHRDIVECNDLFCAISGYAREEIVGRHARMLYPSAEDSDAVERLILEQTPSLGHGSLETRWKRKDGTLIEVIISFAVIRLEGATPVIVSAVLDITERKRMEHALRESNALLRRAQQVAGLGTYTFDMSRGIWTCTPELDALFGIDALHPHNAEGWVSLVVPEQRDEMRDYFLRHVIQDRNRFDREYRIVRSSDGQARWVHGLGELEFDPSGHPVRMVGTIQDVTPRRELENQLRQAQKMELVGQLAGGVAHDFNNILTAISLNLELMGMLELPTEARMSVVELDSLARRAARLTQQLLMFARRQAIQVTALDVNAAMAGLVKMLQRLIGEHITLHLISGEGALWAEVDPGMLDQAVMNLCINARDAMPGGGQLTLETKRVTLDDTAAATMPDARPGHFIKLSVSDTGTGMAPEVLQHMFEPFFTTKEVGKGTGLGLASVHGIVHQHRGWVTVESAVGRGTTFTIFLPLLARADPNANASPTAAAPPGGHERILLVEDEAIVRQVSALTLRRLGYTVQVATDGPDAQRVWAEHAGAFDLLIADMVMPGGLTGLQLAQELRAARPNLRVLIVSGYSEEIIRGESMTDRGVAFLPKPFESHLLAQKIRQCLDQPTP